MFVHGPSRICTHASSIPIDTFASVLTGGKTRGCEKATGVGVGVGVPIGVEVAVGVGVAVAVAVAVAVGEPAETLTTPVIPAKQCKAQKYGYLPGSVKVNSYTNPVLLRTPSSQRILSGEQNRPLALQVVVSPLVTLCILLSQVQRTVSPTLMLTVSGTKLSSFPTGPTVTSKVWLPTYRFPLGSWRPY